MSTDSIQKLLRPKPTCEWIDFKCLVFTFNFATTTSIEKRTNVHIQMSFNEMTRFQRVFDPISNGHSIPDSEIKRTQKPFREPSTE